MRASIRVSGVPLSLIASDKLGETYEGRVGDLLVRVQHMAGERHDASWILVARDYTRQGWHSSYSHGHIRFVGQSHRLFIVAREFLDALGKRARRAA